MTSSEEQNAKKIFIYKLRHYKLTLSMHSSMQEVPTRGSTEDRDWSEENQTFYYSKFQLFDDSEDIARFHQYSLFLDRISKQLGQQWIQEANALYHPHFQSKDIFLILLTIWFYYHPVVKNCHPEIPTKKNLQTFSSNYLEDFNQKILQQLEMKNIQNASSFKLNKTSAKAICMGFFLTANEIWEQMFQNEVPSQNKGFSIFKGVTKKLQEKFEPLMVVTQRITNLFGRKKVKKNWEMESELSSFQKQKIHQNCYQQFKKNYDLEQEIIRKLSQFSFGEEEQQSTSSFMKERNTMISKQKFKDSQSPVQKNSLGNIYQYLTKFLKVKQPWQVASSFVTNILDIGQFQTENGTKVKILRPAQDFYQKLIFVWLTMKAKNEKSISFQQYKENVQCSFGLLWKNKYVIPVKYFYEKISRNWNEISKGAKQEELSDKLLMDILINKIRESMKMDWQSKIKIDRKKSQT